MARERTRSACPRSAWMVVAALVLGCGAPGEMPIFSEELEQDAETVLREATVTLVPPSCAGVVIDEDLGLTAAHCIDVGMTEVDVRLSSGEVVRAGVTVDRARDVALLLFPEPADIVPIAVADELPRVGEPLFFLGQPTDDAGLQLAELADVGRCPTLPAVENALFTTLDAEPGDSGSPVLNQLLRVVGLVHGGAQCEIATPVVGIEDDLR